MVGNAIRFTSLVLLCAASACKPREGSAPRPQVPRTVLIVDNQAFIDMRLYVTNGGQRLRLGLATSKTVTPFTIPSSIITGTHVLSFRAEPLASNRSAQSEQMYVTPGDTVRLMIPPA